MAEKSHAAKVNGNDAQVIKRGPGHRAVDARDAIAELTERAQEISLEAGSKVSAAMKDVISAAAGIAGFAVESARDLIQYMVRRGQMTPEEGEKLLREAEAAHRRRPASERRRATASQIQAKVRAAQRAKAAVERERAMARHIAMVTRVNKTAAKAAARAAKRSAGRKRAARPAKKKKGGKRR